MGITINKLFTGLLTTGAVLFIAACGKNQSDVDNAELTAFRTKVDTFCDSIIQIDNNINSNNISDDDYSVKLLAELDKLNSDFNDFAQYDFPSDYDYLEDIADEAAVYMNSAVVSYHDIFENEYSNEEIDKKTITATNDYASAYKRIKVIISFLNGEISDDATISYQ